MSKSGITFQPKPEGNHYVTIHLAYKLITDGKAPTAALLSLFEWLAESTLSRMPDWMPGQPIPDVIKIDGHCSNSLLMGKLDGLIKESSLKSKIKILESKGFIKTKVVGGRYRHVWYNYAAIAKALKSADFSKGSKSDPSKFDPSKFDGKGSKIGASKAKNDGLRGQKLPATIPKTNQLSNPDLTNNTPNPSKEGNGEISSTQFPNRIDTPQETSLAVSALEQSSSADSDKPKDSGSKPKNKKSGASSKKSNKKGRYARNAQESKKVYKNLPEAERFEAFWSLYDQLKSDMGKQKAGNKQQAAGVWTDLVNAGVNLDDVAKGFGIWAQAVRSDGYGFVWAEFFLGGKKGHTQPYWEEALQQRQSVHQIDEDSEFVAIARSAVPDRVTQFLEGVQKANESSERRRAEMLAALGG